MHGIELVLGQCRGSLHALLFAHHDTYTLFLESRIQSTVVQWSTLACERYTSHRPVSACPRECAAGFHRRLLSAQCRFANGAAMRHWINF
jgi:hypothetical protein